jgi:hypothetical protein
MKYIKDEVGKNLLEDENNYQVMMEWEKPYMEALIERLQPFGDVLEIGFGLGYSADAIQKFNIKTHTIIENNPEVLKKLRVWAKKQKHHVNIIEGDWQDKLKTLTMFDCVFFDDAPSEKYLDEKNIRFYNFYYRILKDHANEGCRLSWYCDTPIYWVSHPYTEWSNKKMSIDIPENVRYITKDQREKKEVYLPLVTYPYGTVRNATPVVFDKFLEFSTLVNLEDI